MSTKPYRLTRGKHHADGTVYKPGDTVYLTDTQYLAFSDRFIAEEVYHKNTELDATIRKAQEDAKAAVLAAHEVEQEQIKAKAASDAKATIAVKTVEAKAAAVTKAAVISAPVPAPQKA